MRRPANDSSTSKAKATCSESSSIVSGRGPPQAVADNDDLALNDDLEQSASNVSVGSGASGHPETGSNASSRRSVREEARAQVQQPTRISEESNEGADDQFQLLDDSDVDMEDGDSLSARLYHTSKQASGAKSTPSSRLGVNSVASKEETEGFMIEGLGVVGVSAFSAKPQNAAPPKPSKLISKQQTSNKQSTGIQQASGAVPIKVFTVDF
jgi:hypothetical protein